MIKDVYAVSAMKSLNRCLKPLKFILFSLYLLTVGSSQTRIQQKADLLQVSAINSFKGSNGKLLRL